MEDVFISYSRADYERILPIVSALKSLGLTAWFDNDLRTGPVPYDKAIYDKLSSVGVVLACWSPRSIEADWPRSEATFARQHKKLVACFIERCQLIPPFILDQTEDLSRWDGDQTYPKWVSLVSGIAHQLHRPEIEDFLLAKNSADEAQLYRFAQKYPDDPNARIIWSQWAPRHKATFSRLLESAKAEISRQMDERHVRLERELAAAEAAFENWIEAERCGLAGPMPTPSFASPVAPVNPIERPVGAAHVDGRFPEEFSSAKLLQKAQPIPGIGQQPVATYGAPAQVVSTLSPLGWTRWQFIAAGAAVAMLMATGIVEGVRVTGELDRANAKLDKAKIEIVALRTALRPWLAYQVETKLRKNIDDPASVYDALKVYLMLAGKAPGTDKTFIVSWFIHLWQEDRFLSEANGKEREGLIPMLEDDLGAANYISLDAPLVDQARQTLTRLTVAELAYALLKNEARDEPIEDWIASQRGGPDVTLVFEAATGASLDTVRVPAFYTYDGFSVALLGHMQTILDKLRDESWVLGSFADQDALKQQRTGLLRGILKIYSRDFIEAWTTAINNLELKPLLTDKPEYLRLSAASSPTSPILIILESIRDETSLTRERPKTQEAANPADKPRQDALAAVANKLAVARREAIVAGKSQARAGDSPPGAAVEAYFKPYASLVDGTPDSRPVDDLLANLSYLYRELVIAADNPTRAKQALDQAELQALSLRANAARLPPALAKMIDSVAKDVEDEAGSSSIAL